MDRVFLLHHVHELYGEDDAKLIGVYASLEMADAARARLELQPGFVDHPTGFEVTEYEINKDHWTEGFVTVVPIQVPRRRSLETVTAHASRLASGHYELLPERHDPTDDWIYQPGETVRCERRRRPEGGEWLVAVERADD